MFDLTKPIQTSSGKPARVLATDLNLGNGKGIVVAITQYDGIEDIYVVNPTALVHNVFIVNVPEVTTFYANLYTDPPCFSTTSYTSVEIAKQNGNAQHIVAITLTDGVVTDVRLN